MTTRTYPATVSRSLDPTDLGMSTVVGQHDRRLTDADINLIQDVQDLKRLSILNAQAPSGCLTLKPFEFRAFDERVLYIPAFDVLFRGEVVHVGGFGLSDQTMNRVEVASPRPWVPGMIHEDARIFVVFLEMWGRALDPVSGAGYHVSDSGELYFYPGGCVGSGNPTQFPDSSLDPFQNIVTTLRVQTQWRLVVEPLSSLAYDFEAHRYGLDPDVAAGSSIPYRGFSGSEDTGYAYAPLLDVTGEPCLWRAGNGVGGTTQSSIDGYTYAMPVALVFQRNKSPYDASNNPFGCAREVGTGTLSSGISGRPDGKFVDIIYEDDVVDARLSVSLVGYDPDTLVKQGISDIFSGAHTTKISRGETPGNKATALGSRLSYTLALANKSISNVHVVGAFDGFMNGFSSDERTYRTTQVLNLSDRVTVGVDASTGVSNTYAWGVGDVVTVALDSQNVQKGAYITEVFVQSYYAKTDGTVVPIALYGGQLQIDGINTRQATIRIVSNLAKISLNLGHNPLIVTLGVKYPSGTGADTQKVPVAFQGGQLKDSALGTTLPVLGVSDYEVSESLTPLTMGIDKIKVYNPFYSSLVFGTRVVLKVANALSTASTETNQTRLNTFSITRSALDSRFVGLYAVSATTEAGVALNISYREIIGDTLVVIVDGELASAESTVFTVLCAETVQAAYNPPVKGVTALEETILVGNSTDEGLCRDSRISIPSVHYDGTNTTIVLHATTGKLKGLAGTDVNPLIWIKDTAGKFVAKEVTVVAFGALYTITVARSNLETSTWFMVGGFQPTPDASSSLSLMISYVPYQGEGVTGRNYTVVYAQDEAFVTTNGTGAAPIVGLQDVFPFDRQFPIAPTLPALASWSDASLKNQAMDGDLTGNYKAKQYNNVAHTFMARVHTNDFITPINGFVRKKLRMMVKTGNRGFSRALPHVGFAIEAPTAKSVLGDTLMATVSSIVLYVNNVSGNNTYDGLTKTTAKKTIQGALASLPPVLRHPVAIVLVDTGYAYSIADLVKSDFTQALMGDGTTRQSRFYCLGNCAFTMQESARITIGRESTTGERILIDASSFAGFGDGPTYAFLVSDSRVIFNGITFKGFTSAAVKCIDSDVEFLDCEFTSNLQAVSAEQGSQLILNGGQITLGPENVGVVLAASGLEVFNTTLKALSGGTPGSFFVAERGSNLTLQDHSIKLDSALESGILSTYVVALAQTNSTITCEPTWISAGRVKLTTNSALVRSISRSPFEGGISLDASSTDAPIL